MKKLLSLFFAAILSVCTLAACRSDNPKDDVPPDNTGDNPNTPPDGDNNDKEPDDGNVEVNVDYSTYGSFWLRRDRKSVV